MGGIDWSGLPYVVELLGIRDLEGLMHRLQVIRAHSSEKAGAPDKE